MKKNDYILMVILLLVGFVFSYIAYSGSRNSGTKIIVKSDGEVYGEYSLFENKEIKVESKYGYNLIFIKDGSVYVEESDCIGGDCRLMGRINQSGRSIVCIPNRLEIYVEGDDSNVDTVAY